MSDDAAAPMHWRVRDFAPGAGSFAACADAERDPAWIALTLPGDLYSALAQAGRIGHPFHDDHHAGCAWVAEREWWWVTELSAAPPGLDERLMLVCAGLDTSAEIWLNGVRVGATNNMFRTFSFDVGAMLVPDGGNVLAIAFIPARMGVANSTVQPWAVMGATLAESQRNLIRKAQFGWGWDWAPALPTVGVWRPVTLRRERRARIAALSLATEALAPERAQVRIDLQLEDFSPASQKRVRVTLRTPDGAIAVAGETAIRGPSATLAMTVPDPVLWWTWDLGAQPLYALSAELYDGELLLDRRVQACGIRTIVLDQSADADEPGTKFFRFLLNGVALFARGACWVPASSMIGALSAADYQHLTNAARAANMNMLRVWGGGVYEHDAFYRSCDALGVLVWQDFMFACAPYPEDDAAFVDNVTEEVTEQILRLRAHPCLALWCGNNESQAIHGYMQRFLGATGALPGALYYDRIMPDLVATFSPEVPYWPGSPSGGPSPNSMRAGDEHNWTVWHGLPPVPDAEPVGLPDRSPEAVAFTRYAEDRARFVSEFGIQAAPSLRTLRRYLPDEALRLDHPWFLGRIKDAPKDKVDAMLLPVTGLPGTIEDYTDFTQITQAEGLKFGIEHFRRRKPHCSGALIWQFNDCWPGVSWSLIDFDGVGKAGYYAVRRAYAPLLASLAHHPAATELWITNDTRRAKAGVADIEFGSFHGGAEWRQAVEYVVPAGGNACVWQAPAGAVPAYSDAHYLHVSSAAGCFPANRIFLAPFKMLRRPRGAVPHSEIRVTEDGALQMDLLAPCYLAFVHAQAQSGWVAMSDNFFDMRAGERRTLVLRAPHDNLFPGGITLRSL